VGGVGVRCYITTHEKVCHIVLESFYNTARTACGQELLYTHIWTTFEHNGGDRILFGFETFCEKCRVEVTLHRAAERNRRKADRHEGDELKKDLDILRQVVDEVREIAESCSHGTSTWSFAQDILEVLSRAAALNNGNDDGQ
jgi:hypothetical protein